MKKYFNYFIYLSVIFLIITLIRSDYLVIPEINSIFILLCAIIVLFIGFLFEALAWQKTLYVYGLKSSFKASIASVGLSVFGKYIPGKIWVIVGRSAFIAKKYGHDESETAYISFTTQIISLWVGFLFGILGLILMKDISLAGILATSLWLVLSLILFVKKIQSIIIVIIGKIIRKQLNIPLLKISLVIKVLPYFIIRWVIFSFSFYLLVQALTLQDVSWIIGLGYPLAGTLAMAAFIIPGGIGVREAIITGLLISTGLSSQLAVTVGAASRLWYLCGEVFIFLLGYTISKFIKKSSD